MDYYIILQGCNEIWKGLAKNEDDALDKAGVQIIMRNDLKPKKTKPNGG